jgi:transposase
MAILKKVVGIDVAQQELVASLGGMNDELVLRIFDYKVFPNNQKGFKDLVRWAEKHVEGNIKVRYVMEATGVYHEALAYYLTDNNLEVSIVLPSKISNYFRTLDINTITDKTASQAITRFGLERNLDVWQKPKEVYRALKQLTREREQLTADKTVLTNHLHAEKAQAFPNQASINRVNKRIKLIDKQDLEIKEEIAAIVKQDPELIKNIDTITTIPGIGKITAVIVLAETNGFELIRNKKQLVSYSGLDVKQKDSGTSVKSKPKISKKGNRHLRKAMYMPALTAIRCNDEHKALFVRLVSRHGIKMKAAVAVQRKLLELIYSIFKSGKPFDKDYIYANAQSKKDLVQSS